MQLLEVQDWRVEDDYGVGYFEGQIWWTFAYGGIHYEDRRPSLEAIWAPSRAWISSSLRSSDIEYPGCGAAGLTEGCGSLRKTPNKKIDFIFIL
jgi:hypothetical protein